MLIYNTYVWLLILRCRGIHKSPCIFKYELWFHSIFLLAYCTSFIFSSSTIKSWSTHAFLENKNKKSPPWWIMTNNAKQSYRRWNGMVKGIRVPKDALLLFIKNVQICFRRFDKHWFCLWRVEDKKAAPLLFFCKMKGTDVIVLNSVQWSAIGPLPALYFLPVSAPPISLIMNNCLGCAVKKY